MRTSIRAMWCALACGAAPLAAWAQVDGVAGAVPEAAALDADGAHRQELAEAILTGREAAAGRSLDAGYRALLKSRLASLATARLEDALAGGQDPGPTGLLVLGDPGADLVYTPVTPCRVLDTRSATAGIMAANTQRNFFVAGSTGFTAQGGNAAGCGVPLGPATGVIINFAAVNPAGAGNIRAWAVANPQPPAPNAVVMNFNPVMPILANGIAVPICDNSLAFCLSDLRLQVDVSATHVVADVVGYFARASAPRSVQLIYGGTDTAAPPGVGDPVFFRNIGTFPKAVASSEIEVTWHGHVRQAGTPGTTFCQYQVRVDGALPVGVTNLTGSGAVLYGADGLATLTGRWRGLSTGVHTVSLWLRGTATTCTVNVQNFSQQQAEVVER
jgi:hypothetical protein